MSKVAMIMEKCELTVLMPCLNEAETLAVCISKAQGFLRRSGVYGEVLVADNGSTDSSCEIARECGARVVNVSRRGYGSALREGTAQAKGKYVIMGDADDSYDFENLQPFVDELRKGNDLVMGNRFAGGIEKDAMPALHRYLGNPVLSFIGRLFYGSDIHDFHCGLRGYNRKSILGLDLMTTGMEYASEMVVKATLGGLKIAEVPTTLKKDGRSRPPHLRSWHDGWRHLKFLLMHAPNWLFFYPGFILLALGLLFAIPLCFTDLTLGPITLGVHSLLYFSAFVVIGILVVCFGYLTRLYARSTGYIPSAKLPFLLRKLNIEGALLIGLAFVAAGIALSAVAFALWGGPSEFGNLIPEQMMRLAIPATSMIIIGSLIVSASFFAGIIGIQHTN